MDQFYRLRHRLPVRRAEVHSRTSPFTRPKKSWTSPDRRWRGGTFATPEHTTCDSSPSYSRSGTTG